MTTVMYRLQTTLQLESPVGKEWKFGETLANKNIDFYQLVISQHTLMNLEYNILCTQLIHDFYREKNRNDEQITGQLISALMYAQLLEHVFRQYLIVPRETIRLQKEQKIYQELLEERGFTFPNQPVYNEKADYFSQFVRNTSASVNWSRLSLIRAKRVLDSIVPFAKQVEMYCKSIAILDAFTNPIISYLSWIFFTFRLSVNLFLIIKHLLPGFWMSQEEKDLGVYTRLKGQLLRRWFELFNDAAWLVAGVLGCFVWVGALSPISPYSNIVFFVYDVVLASIRFHLEMGRLNNLKQHYKEQEKKLRSEGASLEELYENKRFRRHLNDLIAFERLRLSVSVINTTILAFAVIISVPLIAVSPVITLIAAILLFTSTVGAYIATQIIEKRRPSRDLSKLHKAKTALDANKPLDELIVGTSTVVDAKPELQTNSITAMDPFVDAFKQVYQALYASQSSAFKSKNYWQDNPSISKETIENYAKNNENSRTAYAIKITHAYLTDCQTINEEDAFKKLTTNIYQYGYKHSSNLGIFKQSNHKILFNNSDELSNADFKKTYEEADVGTRTHAIYCTFN